MRRYLPRFIIIYSTALALAVMPMYGCGEEDSPNSPIHVVPEEGNNEPDIPEPDYQVGIPEPAPETECLSDSDCGLEEICEENECIEDIECRRSVECEEWYECIDNKCIPPFDLPRCESSPYNGKYLWRLCIEGTAEPLADCRGPTEIGTIEYWGDEIKIGGNWGYLVRDFSCEEMADPDFCDMLQCAVAADPSIHVFKDKYEKHITLELVRLTDEPWVGTGECEMRAQDEGWYACPN